MKRTRLVAVLVATGVSLAACSGATDAGPPTSEQRAITGVHAVVLQTSGDVTIRLGPTERLQVNAGADEIGGLRTDVLDGTLVLGVRPGRAIDGPVSYDVTVLGLDRIAIEGSGEVIGSAVLTGDARLTISGSGSAALSGLHLTSLSTDLSGSGDASVSGTSQASTVVLSGSGGFDGSGLTTGRSSVDSSGSGSAQLLVTERLSATLSGSGDVTYRGEPIQVYRDVSGSGDLRTD